MKSLLLSLLLTTTLFSCGDSSKEKANGVVATTNNQNEIESIFKKSSVNCFFGKDCPQNVAKLIFYTETDGEYQFGTCTGTLVGEDRILTNAHCVPKEIKRPGASCSKQMRIQFPSIYQSFDSETLGCISVVSIFDEKDADIAVLKIQKPAYDRPVAKINRNAEPNEGDITHVFAVDPNDLYGTLKKKVCKTSVKGNIYTNESNGYGHGFLLNGCNVIGGNSGSSLFNQNNEVIGVLYAKVDTKELKSALRKEGFKVGWGFKFNKSGIAANINCLPSLYSHFPSTCPRLKNPSLESSRDFYEHLKKKAGLEQYSNDELFLVINKDLKFKVKRFLNSAYSGYQSANMPLEDAIKLGEKE